MHLFMFMDNCPMNHTVGSWRHPEDRQGSDFDTPEFWQDIAVTAERGCLDGVFIADNLAAFAEYEGSPHTALQYGVSLPMQDPLPLVPNMAGVTSKLGIAVTLSTAAYNPYIA